MLTGSTGKNTGNGIQMSMKTIQHIAAKLINGPAQPSLNGHHGIGVGCDVDSRLQNRNRIEKKYDMYSPRADRDMNAVKAMLLPTLFDDRRQRQTAIRAIEHGKLCDDVGD
jgi:hypothetical protein